jgi:hypothetical protein
MDVTLRWIPRFGGYRCGPLGAQADNEATRSPPGFRDGLRPRGGADRLERARAVIDDAVSLRWTSAHTFWYRNHGKTGYEFLVVDAATGAKRPLFDPVRLASVLSQRADTAYDPAKLPFRELMLLRDGKAIQFDVGKKRYWTCDIVAYTCTGPDSTPAMKASEVKSPDGKWVAYERGGNLYLRAIDGGAETALSTDGTPDYGYGLASIGCCQQITNARAKTELRPYVLWSADSKRLLTHKWDQRNVRQMYLMEVKNPAPILHSYRYALPGDSVIPRFEYYAFDVAARKGTRVDVGPIDAVNTTCCWMSTDTIWKDVRWSNGSDELLFTAGKRGNHELTLMAADARTGAARVILKETGKTFVETNQNSGGIPNWRPVGGGKEVVWWSERDGWGHLYLVDAVTCAIKTRLTSGAWMVSDLLYVDDTQRYAYFTGRGREAGRDPYYRFLYRVKLDGGAVELLTPENADHNISFAPDGKYLVDVYSRPDTIPVSVVRAASGAVVKELQRADISRLVSAGWTMPIQFTVKARDAQTDPRGLAVSPVEDRAGAEVSGDRLHLPGPADRLGRRTPVQRQSRRKRAIARGAWLLRRAGRRDGDAGPVEGVPRHLLRQHDGQRHPRSDRDDQAARRPLPRDGSRSRRHLRAFRRRLLLDRCDPVVSGVLQRAAHLDSTTRANDFTWGEKYQGLMKKLGDSTDSFDSQSNWRKAKNLRGRLMLAYGTLDDNVHPVATQLVIDELIKANKDFDLLVMPNRNHGFAADPYMIRRAWDYFCSRI